MYEKKDMQKEYSKRYKPVSPNKNGGVHDMRNNEVIQMIKFKLKDNHGSALRLKT